MQQLHRWLQVFRRRSGPFQALDGKVGRQVPTAKLQGGGQGAGFGIPGLIRLGHLAERPPDQSNGVRLDERVDAGKLFAGLAHLPDLHQGHQVEQREDILPDHGQRLRRAAEQGQRAAQPIGVARSQLSHSP